MEAMLFGSSTPAVTTNGPSAPPTAGSSKRATGSAPPQKIDAANGDEQQPRKKDKKKKRSIEEKEARRADKRVKRLKKAEKVDNDKSEGGLGLSGVTNEDASPAKMASAPAPAPEIQEEGKKKKRKRPGNITATDPATNTSTTTDAQADIPPSQLPSTPLRTLSQANRATSSPNSTANSASSSKPKTKPKAGKTTSSPGVPRTNPTSEKYEQVSDETLRAMLGVSGAMNELLANRWLKTPELRRLEEAGILSYKKGKFTDDEKAAIRQHLDDLKKVNRLNNDELEDVIMMAGADRRKDSTYKTFWPDLAATVPGRPLQYVKAFVLREYDSKAHKGRWTKEEDELLIRAYDLHPGQWTKIGKTLDRTLYDCRDRYLKELADRDMRAVGKWTPEEERKLVRCIREANAALGVEELSSEAPWGVVVEAMGGTRRMTQCRKKWQDQLLNEEKKRGSVRVTRRDKCLLLQRLKELDLPSQSAINWKLIPYEGWNDFSVSQLRSAWKRMKDQIEGAKEMEFKALLDALGKVYGGMSKQYVLSEDEDQLDQDDNKEDE